MNSGRVQYPTLMNAAAPPTPLNQMICQRRGPWSSSIPLFSDAINRPKLGGVEWIVLPAPMARECLAFLYSSAVPRASPRYFCDDEPVGGEQPSASDGTSAAERKSRRGVAEDNVVLPGSADDASLYFDKRKKV
eukprot:CAMPEP_0197452238 /NCGR_PEP_ID=MMETSP1175-20131217/31551_1 /TAXON_ID=1003142 /ORGANISM="Triceratium dubium, Strain CCMP147" /LENGTH=133 /DNA_ID=CAMNT_0042985197 /DNA_START=125 /DNA_END=527 /DNA_ORIENTATION=-